MDPECEWHQYYVELLKGTSKCDKAFEESIARFLERRSVSEVLGDLQQHVAESWDGSEGNDASAVASIVLRAFERLVHSQRFLKALKESSDVTEIVRLTLEKGSEADKSLLARLLLRVAEGAVYCSRIQSAGDAASSEYTSHGVTLKSLIESPVGAETLKKLLLDDSVDVCQLARAALVKYMEIPEGASSIFEKVVSVVSQEHFISQLNDIKRLRLMDFFTEVMKTSDCNFERGRELGLLDLVCSAIFTDDLLLKLNAFQLLENIAKAPLAAQCFVKEGVLHKLVKELDDPLCASGAGLYCLLKALADLARQAPSDVVPSLKTPSFIAQFDRLFEAPDATTRSEDLSTGAELWSALMCSKEGRQWLLADYPQLWHHHLSGVESTTLATCAATLYAWQRLIVDAEGGGPDGSLRSASPLEETLTDSISKELVPRALKVLQRKLEADVRCAAYNCLAAVALHCNHQNLVHLIKSDNKLIELLLDPTNDADKGAKYAKHVFLEKLAKACDAASSTDRRSFEARISRLVAAGPFAQPEVDGRAAIDSVAA